MEVPAGLGERGLSLWDALSSEDVARNAVVLEACRLADRLDELDGIIQGKGVLNLMQFRLDLPDAEDEPFSVEVKFQSVFSESRQQALAFNTIMSRLVQSDAALAMTSTSKAASEPTKGVTVLDDIRKRRPS